MNQQIKLTKSRVASLLGAVFVLVAIFSRVMNFDLRRDENIYAVPAKLLETSDLYKDFFYNQVPLSPWLFHIVKTVLATDHILLSARLTVFLGWVIMATAAAVITLRLTRSQVVTAFVFLTITTNDILLSTTGLAGTNNFLPMPFLYVGLGIFLLNVSGERVKPAWLLLSGFLLGIAGAIKISAAVVAPIVLLASLMMPREMNWKTRLTTNSFPFAIGAIAGALPTLIYCAKAPSSFLAHVLFWHLGPHEQWWRTTQPTKGLEAAMTLVGKLALGFSVWTSGTNALMLFAVVLIVVLVARTSGVSRLIGFLFSARIILVVCVLAATQLMAMIMTPSFPQYFTQPIAILALLIAVLFSHLAESDRLSVEGVLVAAAIILCVINGPRLTMNLNSVVAPKKWEVERVHAKGVEISNVLRERGLSGKVATLSPIYPLEGDLPVYPELATGPFAYRSGDITPPALAQYFRMTTPSKVEKLLEQDPPAAFLLGFYPQLEEPFLRFATTHGYVRDNQFKIVDREGEGYLLLPPH